MAKPIPVFTFVFAAYAATCAAPAIAAHPSSTKKDETSDPFLEAWRTRSMRTGALFAKVGLLSAVKTGDPRFAQRNSSEFFEEVWLETLAETRLGFIGAATVGPQLPATIKPGQRMRFDRINVLDWRLGDLRTASLASPPKHANGHAREMLAALSETVGT